MSERKLLRALNFDLSKAKLKEFYPKKSYRLAYKDIEKFLTQNGFEHRQWSGYVSKEGMTKSQVRDIIKDLSERFTWLPKCVNRFDVTNVGKLYDLNSYLIDTQSRVMPKETEKTLDQWKQEISKQSQQNQTQNKSPVKDKTGRDER